MASIRIHEDLPNQNVVVGVKRKFDRIDEADDRKKRAFRCLGGNKSETLQIRNEPCCSNANITKNLEEIVANKTNTRGARTNTVEVEEGLSSLVLLGDGILKDEDEKMDVSEICGDEIDAIALDDEYNEDAFEYLVALQSNCTWPNVKCIDKQIHFTSAERSILVDWLVSVADEHQMQSQTLHLSVNYLDRFISKMLVRIDKLQLVGAASMWMAAKFEEVYLPDAKEFVYLCGDAYTVDQLKRMERHILKVLDFKLQPPTMSAFIDYICSKHKLDKQTMYLSKYISELVLWDGVNFFEYLPSNLAAACVALARLTLSKCQPWPKQMAAFSGCNLQQLSPIIKKQQKVFKASAKDPNSSIRKRYMSAKYERVGTLKPKNLILDFEN